MNNVVSEYVNNDSKESEEIIIDESSAEVDYKEEVCDNYLTQSAERIRMNEEELVCVKEIKERLDRIECFEIEIQKLYKEIQLIEDGDYEKDYNQCVRRQNESFVLVLDKE